MHTYPAIHNAMWPGLVGKGPDSEPPIDLETMLDLTAAAKWMASSSTASICSSSIRTSASTATDDDMKRLADKVGVAQSRRRIGGGAGLAADRRRLGDGQRRGAQELRHAGAQGLPIAKTLSDLGIRTYGVVRIDSAASPSDWANDPAGNQKKIAETFRQAGDVAEGYGERLAAEGEICWGGMHSWKRNVELLELVDRPKTLGFQADMAHTLLFTLGYNAPEDRILPEDYDWSKRRRRSTRRSRR